MVVSSPLLVEQGDGFATALIDSLPVAALLVSSTGRVVLANDQSADLFGYDIDSMLNRSADDLLPGLAHAVDAPAGDRGQSRTRLDQIAVRRSGTEVQVEVAASRVEVAQGSFTLMIVRDVTKRAAADAQMHRVLRTLDASNDAIFIFDASTLIFSFVNEGATRLTGYSRAQLLHMSPMDLSPATTVAEQRELVQTLIGAEDSSVASLVRMSRPDGSQVMVETTYQSTFSPADDTTWVVVLGRDMTAKLRRDNELARSQRALALVTLQLETKAAVADDRERIARDLHDTVIQRLFGEELGLLATRRFVEPEAASRIDSTIAGLDQTIVDLRNAIFSLQGPGSAPGGLRGRLLAAVTDSTEALGFEPRLQFDGPIETTDGKTADHLVPVLREALSNVARHAAARDARVTVAVADDVVLTVSDDGVGVPNEVLGGRGLGNMKSRARQLGGTCSIESSPAGGAVVTWRVPAVSRN